MTFKGEMIKENACGVAYFIYYKCFKHEAFNKVVYIIIVGTPYLFYKGKFEFLKFSQKGRGAEFPHKIGGIGKIGGGSSRKGGVSLSNSN